LTKEEEYLMALSEDGCLQQLNLRYKINTKIQDILSTITTFGSVSIETSPPSVVIKAIQDKQAQIMSVTQHPSVKSINDIKLTLHTTFDITNVNDKNTITGCIVSPNGKMISIPLYVDTATVVSSRHVTSYESHSERVITLSNVPSLLRIMNR
jgi:hypothetical protein